MSLKKLNHKGFTAIETMLGLIIVILIVFVGYYVYHAQSQSNKTLNSAAKVAASSPAKGSTKKTTSPNPTVGSLTSADSQAAKIGNGLLAAEKQNGPTDENWNVAYVDSHTSDGQFTTAFKTTADNGSAFPGGALCTNNFDFDSFTATDGSISGSTATVTLLQTVSGDTSGWSTHPQLTLVYANNIWSVNKYDCTGA